VESFEVGPSGAAEGDAFMRLVADALSPPAASAAEVNAAGKALFCWRQLHGGW
jgi:hypothetical protein